MQAMKHTAPSDPSASFQRLYDVVARLRAPDGCPWDREQSPATLRGDLIEETYECVEAINEGDAGHVREELGDVFLLATMISYMHEQEGSFRSPTRWRTSPTSSSGATPTSSET